MELTISNRTIIRIVAIVAASVLAIRLLFSLHTEIVWVLTALFLALALEPAVDRISRFMPKRSRALAVMTVLLVVGALFAFVLVALIPPFAFQLFHLVSNLPAAYQSFVSQNPSIGNLVNSGTSASSAASAIQEFSKQLLTFGGSAVQVLTSVFGGLFAVVTVVILTFFMVLEGPRWTRMFWEYFPDKYRELLHQLHGTITGYVNGNVLKSLIATVATAIMLVILGSPYALALSLLVGILDLIPMVGATLAAISVCLVVLVFKGTVPALWLAVFFIVFQQFENYIIQPAIFAKAVDVSPLVTMLALIVGASLAGFIGALVAIPVAASLQILLRYFLAQRRDKLRSEQPD